MVRHFFLDKTCTLHKDSKMNTGLNPVIELNYGKGVSRAILHFDETEIVKMIEENGIRDFNKFQARLKMVNCFSVDGLPYEKKMAITIDKNKERACSFDLIAFKLPQYFDGGRGYDYLSDFWVGNKRSLNEHGANWFFSNDGRVWEVDKSKIDLRDPNLNMGDGKIWILNEDKERVYIQLEGGIYSTDFIKNEIEKYNNSEDSIIIDRQHFDFGNENMNINITSYIEDIINGAHNYGIGIMFSPLYEEMVSRTQQYVGFFTDHTNTFFHPYIEIIYDEAINDNRDNFCIGKENRLYFYSSVNGEGCNLDNIPTCTINGVNFPVKQAQKGVYYALISCENNEMEANTVEYDLWSNLALNGQKIDDVEMDFEVKPLSNFIKLGYGKNANRLSPTIYNINYDERLNRGEIRCVNIDFDVEYESFVEYVDNAEYRLYVHDGNREYTVIDYTPIEKGFQQNYFTLFTEDLIPNEYYVDIKVQCGRDIKYFKEILRFTVISDITERYE